MNNHEFKHTDFWHTLIGPGPLGVFLGYMVIAYICAFIMIFYGISRRNPSSPGSPVKFSMTFFFIDNLIRLFCNLLLIPVFIRLLYVQLQGTPMYLAAMGLGFGVDALCQLAQRYGIASTRSLANNLMPTSNQPVTPPASQPPASNQNGSSSSQ